MLIVSIYTKIVQFRIVRRQHCKRKNLCERKELMLAVYLFDKQALYMREVQHENPLYKGEFHDTVLIISIFAVDFKLESPGFFEEVGEKQINVNSI